MDDYQKACIRSWCVDHAIDANKGRWPDSRRILEDAKLIHRFVTGAPPVDIVELNANKEENA